MEKFEKEFKRMEELIKIISQHNYNYYVLNSPTVSDKEYDILLDELFALEKKTGTVFPGSPTGKVGSEPITEFKKVKHKHKLMSLDKSQSIAEIDSWMTRNKKTVKYKEEYTLEYKFDGLALAITYDNGNFLRATTRGNGLIGEDVSEQVKTIRSVPLIINYKGYTEIQGEVVMKLSVLKDLNKKTNEPLKNARNAAAGALRNIDPKVTKERKLDFFAYNVNYIEGRTFKKQTEITEFLKQNNFCFIDYQKLVYSIDDIAREIEYVAGKKNKLDFLIDGLVIKINDITSRESLGSTDRFPRGMIAYKFEAEEITTVLRDVVWQVGRTGKLTPIGLLEPTELAGVTVSRATLNNFGDIQKKQVKIGSRIFVRRSNEVIPEILGIAEDYEGTKEINEPTSCPVCGSHLDKTEANLFCSNEDGCSAQIIGRLTHFVSRNAVNITGLSDKTIKQLYSTHNIKAFHDLYNLTAAELAKLEGFKDKKINNLLREIAKSKTVPFENFIYALGIDSVGRKTAKTLADEFKTLDNLMKATREELCEIRDIGEITADDIFHYFLVEYNKSEIKELLKLGIKIVYEDAVNSGVFKNERVVLTGGLENYSRPDAIKLIESRGGEVMGSVSAKTTLVIAGSDAGSKLIQAKQLGTKVIDEKQFIKMLEDKKKK